MNRPTLRTTASTLALAAAVAAAAGATGSRGGDWPQFRGARRDGVSTEKGLLGTWPDGGPKLAWRRPIGEGYSAVSVAGGRLYTMYAADDHGEPSEFAAAFDPGTGNETWRTKIGKKLDTEFGNGPRATPTVDRDTVFVLGSFGEMVALAAADGAERWRVDLKQAFGGKQPHFGFSTSAVVDDGQVIVEGGGPEGKSYAALDRATGAVKWTSGDGGQSPGYNSALTVEIAGVRGYVAIVGNRIRSIDAQGKELWSQPWAEGEAHAMPVLIPPDKIFASGVEGVGAALYQVAVEEGRAQVRELWKNPQMRNHFSSSLYHDGHIYGFDNATLKCIGAADGSLKWAKRGLGKGSLIYADGHLAVLSDQGLLVWVKATPEAYLEEGSVQALQGLSWTAPALAGGRLYLRNHTEMVAYDLKG